MVYTKEECLEALQDAVDELGHPPTVDEYKGLDISPSYNTIIARCGGWIAAKEALGLEHKRGRQYSEADCLEAIQEAAEILGEEPSYDAYERLDISPSAGTSLAICGTWVEAKEKEAWLTRRRVDC
ncbi:homing endonuclease associated repeat-containing protein [Halobacterium zhouii]|uniref:homing endonuclease associated repeat-containing protein n=1 Tax=Halobacterium zhouii TaxID=2902624 RepID=UPI001E360BDC|nr:hypothetical protein [Halobacterium zhouii]